MNRKISLGLALALIFVAMAGSVAGTMAVSMKMYNSIIKDLPKRSQTYSLLAEIDDVIRTNYYGEINETLLTKIADLTDGKYFRATNTKSLQNIYKQIDELEKTKVDVAYFSNFNEMYYPYAIAALLVFFLELLLRFTIFRKLP